MLEAYSIDQVAKMVGQSRDTMRYHHRERGLPEPSRVGTRRFYTPEDVSTIRAYFEAWVARERKTKKKITTNN